MKNILKRTILHKCLEEPSYEVCAKFQKDPLTNTYSISIYVTQSHLKAVSCHLATGTERVNEFYKLKNIINRTYSLQMLRGAQLLSICQVSDISLY